MKLTDLEFKVLLRIAEDKNPWALWAGNTGPSGRSVSQAIERLKRKGALFTAYEPGRSTALTEAGKLYLTGASLAGKISKPKP